MTIGENKMKTIEEAARALYMAGAWTLHVDVMPASIQAEMWQDLRDALGLEEGTATNAGVGWDKNEIQ